jgi:hypothetical protein
MIAIIVASTLCTMLVSTYFDTPRIVSHTKRKLATVSNTDMKIDDSGVLLIRGRKADRERCEFYVGLILKQRFVALIQCFSPL